MIAAVVAVDENFAIGLHGEMLVSVRGDLKMFSELTSGHTVIMGRKTFDALPNGALPNRRNIVISSQAQGKSLEIQDEKGAYLLAGMENVVEMLSSNNDKKLFVIGGGMIYKELLPYCERVYLTKIKKRFPEADTYFPNIDFMPEWHRTVTGEIRRENGTDYQFCVYDRI